MSDTTKPALPEPAAETVMDLFQDHEGPVEALEYLPIGTKLYTADQLRAAIAAERERNTAAHLACGHPAELMLRSAETGAPLYCELCDDKAGRRDAEKRESELQAELSTLRQHLAEAVRDGWTDAEADAARLALELECLLTDKDVPMPALSRWWDSAHEALGLHRARFRTAIAAQLEAKPAGRRDRSIRGGVR